MSITGLPGQGPVRAGAAVADVAAGLFAALGVLVALLEREVSGEGQYVRDLAARSADLHARFPGRALADRQGRAPPGRQQSSDQHPDRRLQDQGRPHQYRDHRPADLAALLQGDRRASISSKHPDYESASLRSKNRDALNAEIERRSWQKRTSAEWIDRLNAQGVACRADLRHRRGVRGPAGEASRHGDADANVGSAARSM